ncbi:NEL-type E3 ubiquitin ligase domain-containing protein [Pseudomonas sp. NPDC089569]|uniref:NEL-type E3 ubiquitin ligase domain-containing protein n=1 Tax=Pseudomonas sp. NPDC089569 TaxID=3390722 RepID=UPI003CFDF0A0
MPIHEPTQSTMPMSQDAIRIALLQATGDLDKADVLLETLPDWLLKASSASLAALDQVASELQTCGERFAPTLGRLQPLKAFCMTHLDNALTKKWPVTFNVEGDYLQIPGVECGCSLLEVAMQNFSADETQDGGFPEESVVRIASAPEGVVGLTPVAFASLCRELDLGRLYQEHFEQVFGVQTHNGTVIVSDPVARDIRQMKKLLLQLDLHLAGLKGNLWPAGQSMLQRLIDANGVVGPQSLHYEGRPLIMQSIEIGEVCIWGVVVFSARSVQLHPDEWCLVYMPGEPHRPLYEYPTFNAFKQYLTLKLNGRDYKNYFANTLDEDSKVDFMTSFASTRQLGFIKARSIQVSLFDFMLHSHLGKLQRDARALAVPTADVDEEVRSERLQKYLEVSVTVASLAGLFVPVLGQLMTGVAVGQLLGEVYEGVEDWRQGDKDEALAHLIDIAQNIALMAAAVAGQKVVGSVVSRTVRQHPQFFEAFAAIFNKGGQPRLWKSDLRGYEQPLAAGQGSVADEQGIVWLGDQPGVHIDQLAYAVEWEPVSKLWRIRHPARNDAYGPTLNRSHEGGWRHLHEQPEQWTSVAYTLRRLDPRLSTFDDATLKFIARVTGTALEPLQRSSTEGLPLSARLKDMIERVRLDQQLRQFIAVMARGETGGPELALTQLHTLPTLPGWPSGRYIEVIDKALKITATYPPTRVADEALSVRVTEDQLARGELLQTVIDGLYPQQVEKLLGGKAAKGGEGSLLARKLGAALKKERRVVFDQLYSHAEQSLADDVLKVQRVFADVPSRQAQDLISRATSLERAHLRTTGRVPMRLAQQLREATSAARIDRALLGLHIPNIANADTEKLLVQLLPCLHGWNLSIRLEIREASVNGRLLETAGARGELPERKCTVVKSPQGYAALDEQGQSSGPAQPGPDGLCVAILKAIPPQQRIDMGFAQAQANDGTRLRGKLLDVALETPEHAVRILATGQLDTAVAEPVCVQSDSPAGAFTHSRALMRKIKRLYPLLTETEAKSLLDGLGNDPLSRANRVRQLQQQLKQLRQVLESWSEDESALKALGGNLAEARHSRRQVADLIEDSWRRITLASNEQGKRVPSLSLDGMRVGKLPILPADLTFDHVKQLSLGKMELDNDVAYFLKAFKQIESLELERNKIGLLPEVISLMPALKRLNLSNNRLQLTEQTLLKLSRLRNLEVLILNDNPLGATLDVGGMFDLRYLSIRETRATELPKGLSRLPNLDRVDLRDNDIKELPDWLFSSPRRFSETINLRHNPLSGASSDRLKTYRDSVGNGMGYIEDDMTRLNEQAARALWLPEQVGETFDRRSAIWTALKDDPQSDGLFRLLSELIHTADSEQVQEDMSRRVWKVLEAVEGDSALREQVLELAANPINCTDSAALNFSHLEVAVEVDKASHPATYARSPMRALLTLGRGLFRLDQLDRIAREHVRDHPSVDPLEVNLAYRTGLAEHFQLPGQPRHMRYASLSGVTASALEAAKSRVTRAELSPALLTFLAQQPFWCDYLKRQYPRQFNSINETWSSKIDAVFDQADRLTSGSYLTQLDAIKVAKEDAENAVLERLTEAAIRVADLGICAMPED